jgi:cell division protein FtsB
MLALIVINAGLIPSYDNGISNAKATLNDKVAQYQALNSQIDSVSSNEYVIEQATSDLGMIKR